MKKAIAYLLVMGLTISLTACGNDGKKTSEQSGDSTSSKSVTSSEQNNNSSETGSGSGKKSGEQQTEASSTQPQKASYKLFVGETKTLKGKTEDVSYQSSNEKIVTVTKEGQIQGLKGGKTTISVAEGNKVSQIQVTVRKRGMVYPKYTIMKGEHLDLQFSNDTVVTNWVSDQPAIASVSKKGKVKAKKTGKTTIHGTDGKHTYTCHLTVKKKVGPIIYLTFDDGPNRYTTPKVLNILKKNKVKATFFELKPAKKDFDLTRRVVKEGHALAMHGYQHKYDIIYRSVKVYHENLTKLQELFFQKTGVWCTNSRFPGGSSNTVSRYNPGVMTRITKKIHSWGFHYFDWNIGSGDSDGIKTSDGLYQNVVNQLSKKHDNVILMHDYYKNDVMLGALDRIIKYGKKNGYIFMPITASTEEVHHGVNN